MKAPNLSKIGCLLYTIGGTKLVRYIKSQNFEVRQAHPCTKFFHAGADPGMGRSGPGLLFSQPNCPNSALFWAVSAIRSLRFTNLDTRPPLFTNPASAPVQVPPCIYPGGSYKENRDFAIFVFERCSVNLIPISAVI